MDRMFPGVLEIPPGKRFAPICGDLTLFLQFCFCHICPSHHVAGQTVHVQNWKDEQGLSQRDIPKSQHRKPGAKTGSPQGDFYPADAGIVICDTDFRYGIPRRAVSSRPPCSGRSMANTCQPLGQTMVQGCRPLPCSRACRRLFRWDYRKLRRGSVECGTISCS